MANKPNIRFKGFTDDWEQRKLGEMVDYVIDNRGKNPDYYCNIGIPVIDNYLIKNTLYPDMISANRFIDNNIYDNFIRKYCKKDDILMTLVGNGIGNITMFPDAKAVIIQNTLGLRTNENKRFLFFLIMSYNKEIVSLDRGMAQPSIRQDEVLDLDMIVPGLEEQTKIGAYFSTLDHLITLHQRKCDETKKLKKFMLQKMFPKNGEKNPEIRFAGFTDDWEQRKLGDSLLLLKDGTHGTHADANEGPLLLSAKNIKDGTIKWDDTDRRISLEEYEKIHSKFNLKSGDVLLTIVGSIGETAILQDSESLTFQRSVAFLRPQNDITSEFLYSEIQSEHFQKELESRKSTSAQPGIYLGDLAEIPLYFPSVIDEQKKIGQYFSTLDHLITLHQRKCDNLKFVKKFMLQNMFPQKG